MLVIVSNIFQNLDVKGTFPRRFPSTYKYASGWGAIEVFGHNENIPMLILPLAGQKSGLIVNILVGKKVEGDPTFSW